MDREEYFQAIAKKQRLILVEGKDDALVVAKIREEENLAALIQILCYRQTGELSRFLDALVRDAGFAVVTHIALTRDSDNGATSALQSLHGAWGQTQPKVSSLGRQTPQVSYFAIPDNQTTGRLENLCLLSPTFPDILNCAEEMYRCATAVAEHQIDREKSIVSAYLSMMTRPGLELGTGAQAGCWDLNSDPFQPLRQFVRSLAS